MIRAFFHDARSGGPARRFLLDVAFLVLIFFALRLTPHMELFSKSPSHWVDLHLLFEIGSVFVFFLMALVSLKSIQQPIPPSAHIAAVSFFAAGIFDLLHAMVYDGMPLLVGHSGPDAVQRAIYFWLAARFTTAVGMLSIALLRETPSRIWLAFSASALLVSGLVYLGLFHLSALPPTYIPGQGTTPFKFFLEMLISVAFFMACAFFLHTALQSPSVPSADSAINFRSGLSLRPERAWAFARFCLIMAFCDLTFAVYTSYGDLNNIFGHVIKLWAGFIMLREILRNEINEPLSVMSHLQQQLVARANERAAAALETSDSLSAALLALESQMIRSEQAKRLASLGSLVSGFAHALNTPAGNARLAASSLRESLTPLREEMASGHVRRSRAVEALDQAMEQARCVESNLNRLHELVTSYHLSTASDALLTTTFQERVNLFESASLAVEHLRAQRPALDAQFAMSVEPLIIDGHTLVWTQFFQKAIEGCLPHPAAPQPLVRLSARLNESRDRLTVQIDRVGPHSGFDLARAFEPFYASNHGFSDSGLALFWARDCAMRVLGGDAKALPISDGTGHRFIYVLPCEPQSASPAPTSLNLNA